VRRFLGILLVAAALSVQATAAAPNRTRLDIFVYDQSMPDVALIGATVTVVYDVGVAVGETRRPHGQVRITLFDVYESVLVTADAEGYCEGGLIVVLDGGSRAGGHGIFLGLAPEPCAARP